MKVLRLLLLFIAPLTLAGCQQQTNNETVEVTHAFGTTAVPINPQRVATISWGNQDVALALGVVPVGMAKSSFGKLSENGVPIWTQDKINELDPNAQPVYFDETDSLDYEAIASTNPDVILAAYSGITQEEYDKLSQIAPTVAYPNQPWSTLWREQTILDAQGLNKGSEGEALVAQTEQLINEKVANYQNIEGKTAAFTWINPATPGSFYLYLPTDARCSYLQDLGLTLSEDVYNQFSNETGFFVEVNSEAANILNNVDILFTYGDDQTLATLQNTPIYSQIPAIANGSTVVIDINSELANATTPTILSIPATIDQYLALISDAANKVKTTN